MENDVLLRITALSDDGRGVARQDGKVYFVSGALPGQTVHARVERDRKRFAEARCTAVAEDMAERAEPLCPHFGECGGCPMQIMPYPYQLAVKEGIVRDALTRIGGAVSLPMHDIIASPKTAAFRNKMEFAFGTAADGRPIVGLRRRASREVFAVRQCAAMPEFAVTLAQAVCSIAREKGLSAYRWPEGDLRRTQAPCRTPRKGRGSFSRKAQARAFGSAERGQAADAGFLRFCVVRHAFDAEGKPGWWVQLVSSPADAASAEAVRGMGAEITARFPEVRGFVHDVRRSDDMLAQGEKRLCELGPCGAHMTGYADDLPLKLDIASFFQVNSETSRLLWHEVKKLSGLFDGTFSAPPVLWDLYCGSGAPGLLLAPKCASLLGVEYDAAAVRRAAENAEAAGLSNCRYVSGDASEVLTRLADAGRLPRPDIVLVDPPRAGMDPRVAEHILAAAPQRIVYVSCGPATLARDVRILCGGGYALTCVRPADMFPHTPHVETVALLSKTTA